MKTDWISVEEELPKVGPSLLLVRIKGSSSPALAIRHTDYWKVQPLFANWFVTKYQVTHWQIVEKGTIK